ncbi:hypothetical protein D9M71_620840 [compost metagenome]
MQFAGLLVVQQGEEVAAQVGFAGDAVDAYALVAEAVPVAHDGRESGEQTVGDVTLLVEAVLRLQGAEHRATGAHHVHRVGVGGDALEHFLECLRQVTQALQALQVGIQLGGSGQFAVEQQVGDFLEQTVLGELADIVAAIGQTGAFLAYGGQGSLSGNLATQASAAQYFCFSHGDHLLDLF